jgi:hypothetical protein
MRYHTQNLNEDKTGKPKGSKLWHGRAWWVLKRHELNWEWCFGKHARMFHWALQFGEGEGDDGILLMAGIPWLFSFYFGVAGVLRCKACELGIAIHNHSFWLHLLSWSNETCSNDPWWRKSISWNFPWDYEWFSTEILEHKANLPGLAKTVWMESRADRGKRDVFEAMRKSDVFKKQVSETYDYAYTRKNNEVQQCKATVFVERRTWRMKWWPLLPFKLVRTSIDVHFDDEVGEGIGSWKGGTVGCGYDLKDGETPLECLRRMERERKFNR